MKFWFLTSECMTESKWYQVRFRLVAHKRKVQNNKGLNKIVYVSFESPEVTDEGHWHRCKIQAKLSTSVFPNTHNFTLTINLETIRVNLIVHCPPLSISPTRTQGCHDRFIPGLLGSIRLCPFPFCIHLSSLLHPRNASMSPLELIASHHTNSSDPH